jgi:hypothetical protein
MTTIRNSALCVALALGALEAQAASYFVQPLVTVFPGGFINGLEIDGATSRTEGFFNAPTGVSTEVDLEAGTIRGLVEVGGGGLPSGASQGRFGEQVTFQNADNTTVFVTFDVDGTIFSPARDPNLNDLLQVSVEAYMAVFDPSVGANSSNWFGLSFGNQGDQTLAKDRIFLDFTDPTEIIDDFISDGLSVALDVTSTRRSFDIFVNLTLIANPNSNPGPVILDFLNTATMGIDTDPGVTYTSLSGVFLESTGVTVVPVPAALPLLASALGLMAGFRRNRRRSAAVAS